MNSFTFNGVSTSQFKLLISEKNIYSAPTRNLNVINVPGRDGDLIYDNGSFNNVELSYTCSCKDINIKAGDIKNWLSKEAGYKVLTDTYDPSFFRYASLNNGLEISEMITSVGTFIVKFSCKPYRYNIEGQNTITLNTSTTAKTITNPYEYSSLPLISITGTKAITLQITTGGVSTNRIITLPATSTRAYIDSELMAVYDDNMNLLNSGINFVDFPELKPGNSSIKFTKGTGATLTAASIIPRWRTL